MMRSGSVVVGALALVLAGCGSSSDEEGGAAGAGGLGGSGATAGNAGRAGASPGGSGGSSGAAGSGAAGASAGSSGASNPACGATPCGGDVVGTWQVLRSCFEDTTTTDASCPGSTIGLSNVQQTGSVTFGADGSYVSDGAVSFDFTQSLPLTCVMDGGGSCALYELLFQSIAGNGTCSETATTCDCSASISAQPSSATGTYTTSGSTLTVTQAGGMPNAGQYCVEGSTLHLHSDGFSPSTMGTSVRLTGDLVLTRQ